MTEMHSTNSKASPAPISDAAEKKWDMYAHRLISISEKIEKAAKFSDARVLLLGFHADELRAVRGVLCRLGVMAVATAPNVNLIEKITFMNLDFTHIFVNFDGFADTESGIEALITFRQSVSDVKVIICSSNVRGDDFGSERSCIGAATLRFPLTLTSVRTAFSV
jgi:hypothetical protein